METKTSIMAFVFLEKNPFFEKKLFENRDFWLIFECGTPKNEIFSDIFSYFVFLGHMEWLFKVASMIRNFSFHVKEPITRCPKISQNLILKFECAQISAGYPMLSVNYRFFHWNFINRYRQIPIPIVNRFKTDWKPTPMPNPELRQNKSRPRLRNKPKHQQR